VERESKVIHEFDQIVWDLRPFWGVEPRVLRERVSRVASNEWNNLGLVTVRDHKATIAVAPQWKVFPQIWPFDSVSFVSLSLSVFCREMLMVVDAGTDG